MKTNDRFGNSLNRKIMMSDLVGKSQPTVKSDAEIQFNRKIKVVHLSAQDFGGAGKAAYRLHRGLQSIGVSSKMIVLNKGSGDPSVKILPNHHSEGMASCLDAQAYNSPIWDRQNLRWHNLMGEYPNRPAGLEMFSDAISEVRLDCVHEIQEADIINLHWVAGTVDWTNAPLGLRDKPIIWTLHDMNPFTGGCHYAGGCKKYVESCGECPQLGSNVHDDLSHKVWEQKRNAYQDLRISVVTPSRWLGECVSESKLFSHFPVRVIPYGFPLDTFRPHPKAKIHAALKIPDFEKIILFGAHSVLNERKGFGYLIAALNKIPQKKGHDITILTFGSLPKEIKIPSKYSVVNLGLIEDEKQLAEVYSAADVFVIPSLEDNLPNTVVEAMACGTPVVGFKVGGINEMIEHRKSGFLAIPKDINSLSEGIEWVISSGQNGIDFSTVCRETAKTKYALEHQAQKYFELYNYVIDQNPAKTASQLNKSECPSKHFKEDDRGSTRYCITAESFASFTYSRNSHFSCFKNNDFALYNKKIVANDCDLKVYQDLLVYSFILENIPKGAKILEIGGGESRVLNAIKDEYECWNIDKLEGRGCGPISVNASGYCLVKAYIGEFSEALPDNYFDFVFSISALEHVGEGKMLFQNICHDIDRVLKPGGYSLHCFDIIIKSNEVWTNNLLLHMFQKYETFNTFIPLDEIKYDKDLYYMSKNAYVRGWEPITKEPYEEFGKPASYNILWRKTETKDFRSKLFNQGDIQNRLRTENIKNKQTVNEGLRNNLIINTKSKAPRITIVTPSYNQGEFLEECIDSILSQNYPNLEYIIMDGGSNDGSVEIIKKYEKHLAYWQSKPDKGQYDAINQGFKRSSGQILAWVNSDDKYHEDSFLKAAYIFNQYPSIEWITGRPTAWKENGDLAWVFDPLSVWDRKTYLKEAFKKYYIQQESTFWRATLWQKAGARLRTDLKFAGDLELWVRFFRYEKLYTVDTILGGYRHQRNQKTKLNMEKYIEESEQIVRDEIANIQKGKFSSMLIAPSPILLDAHDFNNYKQRSLQNKETGDVLHGKKGQRDNINFQQQNATSSSCDMPKAYLGTGQDPAFTIATSIAPHEIELQIQALESWRNFGFDVVSINSQAEIDLLQEFFPEVRFVSTPRNGNRKFGKPYVYFDDLLEYFRSIDSEIFGIVNSDIHLIQDKGIVPYILKETKNSMVYGSRVDIESLNHLSGKFYDDGFDFFFFHKSLLSCFPKSETFIGVTWWDFWAPLIPALEGVPIKKLVSPFAYHISHPNRWDEKQWDFMGKYISDYLYRERDKNNANQHPDTPWSIFDAIHSNATHLYFIDQDLSPEERVKISYQKIGRVALSISTFLKKISIPLQYNGLPQSFDTADHHGDLGTDDLNKIGEVLLGKGDLEGACRCFSMAIEKDPNFARAHTNAGVSYSRLGDAKRALQHFKTALAIDPTDGIATLFWTKALIDLHLKEAVRKHLSSYLFKNPGDLVIGKLFDRFEKGDDLSKLIDLEIDISFKAKTSKIKDVTRRNDTYRIGYDHQNADTPINRALDDAGQNPPSLETDSKIGSIEKVPLKEGIVGPIYFQAMPLIQKSNVDLIQKKFPIKSIPNNKEGLIKVNGIEGFLAENDIIQLYSIAYDLPRNGHIIEVGSYLGLSTYVMAQALIDSQNHGACIYCIDDWVAADAYFKQNGGKGNAFDAFRSNLKRVGVDKYIQIKKKKSLDAVADFLNDSADLVFLDGDHSFEGCYADLRAWYPKVKPNGILIGHDYADYFEGIPRAVQKFINENQLDSGFKAPPKGSSIFEIRKPQTDTRDTGVRTVACSNPLISVITPSLNQSQFIEQTITSVLNQGYANIEHIVIDGGSTDGTIEILKKYSHLKWISDKDGGQSEAINKGLAMASGQIFNWLNSDDYLEPGALLKIAEAYRQNPNAAGWVGGCRRIGNDGRLINVIFPNHTNRENIGQNWNGRQFYQPACFLNLPIVKAIGGLNTELYCAFDLDLWIRILENGKFHIGNGIWANALIHSSAKTQASRAKMFEETIAVQNKYGFSEGAENRYQRVFGKGKLEFVIPQNLRSHMVESQKQYPVPDMIAANEKPIVFISTYLPRFDKASAHNRIFHILKILKSYKIKIIFIYSVETKQDQFYKDHFKDHIDFVYIPLDLAKYYNLISSSNADYVWVTNLWSIHYFRFIVQLTDKFGDSRSFKLIADTMDFHFKKYKRKYDYQKNQNDLNVANQFKEFETQLYTFADCVLTVSENEKSDIQSHISGVKSIRVIPNIHQISNDIKSYDKRNHICFVGNFEVNHNVEATRHFIRNIFPLILKHNPDVEFHIIGHNASQYRSEFESPNVKVIGYVDNLESTFGNYKLFVCPMLYGAGMKGKIGAAAAAGLPFVSTTIGTEGFPVSDGVECFISDDPIEFAGKCDHLLNDPICWHNFSIKARLMIADNYSPGKVAKRLEKIITDYRIGKNRVKGKRLARIEDGLSLLKSRLNKIGWISRNERYKQFLEYIEKNEAIAAPDVSIIVISWRCHPDTIHNFETLTKQRDTNFELIFVDNGGEVGEFQMLKPYIDTYIKLNTNTGAYLARNVGSLFANAPILLFLEDDGIPANNLIKAHLDTFAKYDVIAVRGVYKAKSGDNPLNKLANHYYLGDLPFPRYSDLEGNSAYESKIFFKVGGWDDEIYFGGGGVDLSIRLMSLEPDMCKQIYSPGPVIFHDYATDEGHLKEKRQKQIESFERLRGKHQIFDSFHRAWARFTGHHELIPRRMTQSGRRVTDISTKNNTLLDGIFSCYQSGDMQQTAKLLGKYQRSLKQGFEDE